MEVFSPRENLSIVLKQIESGSITDPKDIYLKADSKERVVMYNASLSSGTLTLG